MSIGALAAGLQTLPLSLSLSFFDFGLGHCSLCTLSLVALGEQETEPRGSSSLPPGSGISVVSINPSAPAHWARLLY